jgi:hypothetical protein
MRVHWLLLGVMLVAGAAPTACGGDETTNFGPADGLVGRTAPAPTATATGTSTATGTATTPPAGDAGTPPPDDDGGTTPPAEAGAGACAVSWTNDVFPLLESTGSGSCGGATCHANGGQQPTILDNNPTGTYNSLKGYTLLNNVGYIVPGNTNLSDSAMDCNLVLATCGATPMPEAPGALSTAQKTTISTWLACGAPEN